MGCTSPITHAHRLLLPSLCAYSRPWFLPQLLLTPWHLPVSIHMAPLSTLTSPFHALLHWSPAWWFLSHIRTETLQPLGQSALTSLIPLCMRQRSRHSLVTCDKVASNLLWEKIELKVFIYLDAHKKKIETPACFSLLFHNTYFPWVSLTTLHIYVDLLRPKVMSFLFTNIYSTPQPFRTHLINLFLSIRINKTGAGTVAQ